MKTIIFEIDLSTEEQKAIVSSLLDKGYIQDRVALIRSATWKYLRILISDTRRTAFIDSNIPDPATSNTYIVRRSVLGVTVSNDGQATVLSDIGEPVPF